MADNKNFGSDLDNKNIGQGQSLDRGANIGGNIDSGNVTDTATSDLGADVGGDIRTTNTSDMGADVGTDLGTGMRSDVANERGSINSGSDIGNVGSGTSKDFSDSFGSERAGEKKEGFMDKVGDMVEGLGHKVSEAGAPGLGQKIHDLGDKLEEKHDNPSHPHDV